MDSVFNQKIPAGLLFFELFVGDQTSDWCQICGSFGEAEMLNEAARQPLINTLNLV